ncbi:MAG TPA: carboxymuconolactone decarboxylase family protein, partial [Alphaproteobacteria bacterium]|nr:carboxymuconolactone decarboxylase family protein [Alphaproteobacteria bacterium]
RAAREMAENVEMPEPLFRELQAALGDEQIVDLVVTIATYCAVVRILASLAIEVEPEYQPYLDMFPLPAA